MRIAYCEDEPAQRSRMELLLHTFAERKRLPLTVEAFSDSAAFLFHYPDSYPFDLIFLDIDLGGMDGMALARKIRETDSEVPILFLTNHREYVFEGYEVQAFRYLLKPVTEDTLFPLLDELQTMRGQEKPHLLLSLGGETQKLFLSDLLFVESDNHYLTLHTAAGTETFKKNLSVTFACPLSLGQESECECVDVKTEAEAPDFEQWKAALNAIMPAGIVITHVGPVQMKADLIAYACYRITYPAAAAAALDAYNALESAPVEKHGKKGNKIIELKEHLPKVEYTTEGDSLHMDLCLPAAQELNLNPSLLTGFLEEKFGLPAVSANILRKKFLTADKQLFV